MSYQIIDLSKELYNYIDKPCLYIPKTIFYLIYIYTTLVIYTLTIYREYNKIEYDLIQLGVLRIIGLIFYINKCSYMNAVPRRRYRLYIMHVYISNFIQIYEICIICILLNNILNSSIINNDYKMGLTIFLTINILQQLFPFVMIFLFFFCICNRMNIINFLQKINKTLRYPNQIQQETEPEINVETKIENISLIIMRKAVVNDITDTCSICLNNYTIDENIGMLQCTHKYHFDCVNMWINQKSTCPICRMNVSIR